MLVLVIGLKRLMSANEDVVQHSERKGKRGVVTRAFTLRRPYHAPEYFDSENQGQDQRDEDQPESAEIDRSRGRVCADWLVWFLMVSDSSSFFEWDGAVSLLDFGVRLSA